MSVKKKTPKLLPEDACMLMHTALRKTCDSYITSAMYNFIHTIEIEPSEWNAWWNFGELTAEALTISKNPLQAIELAFSKFRKTWDDFAYAEHTSGNKSPKYAEQIFRVLNCMMECFDEDDWRGMSWYLNE